MGQITFPSHIDGTGETYLNQTGTGAQQIFAHNLGHIPPFVLAQLRDTTTGNTIKWSVDLDNIYVTATNGAIYDVIAFSQRGF